jgi:N-acetylglucosamine kinase-like BadF-type ATPase
MNALYLAVDGGNSKTDVVLGATDGRVLGYARGPTSSPDVVGLDGMLAVLDELIHLARTRAGVPPDAPVALLAAYLAGADLPVQVERLQAAVAARGWAARSIVDNDCFALMRSGADLPDAVVVVCGAGINCAGRTADGRTARFVALGAISGDWGGGKDLAEHALRLAARGEDGRGEPTALSAAVARHFDRPSVEAVSIGLHFGEIPMAALADLAPLLFAVAATGDPVAVELVARQADEILALYRVAVDRLGLRAAPHALVLGGGVLRARHAMLHDRVAAGARALAPRVEIIVPELAPVAGAALLALDALGCAGPAEDRLRAELRGAP